MTTTTPAAAASAEAPLLLTTEAPRTLSFSDQAAFWANLGVSLIGFSSAAVVLLPTGYSPLPIPASLLAIALGTVAGMVMTAIAGVVGTRTGAPAMAVLRGLFGTKLSWLPSLANIFQMVGWGVYEITVIVQGVDAMPHTHGIPRPVIVLAAGALCTAMAIWPLSVLRALRKYVTGAVAVAMLYFTVQLLRNPIPHQTGTSWSGFFPAVDAALALSVSFLPMAADYMRHARSSKQAGGAAVVGYSITQFWCYAIGIVALLQAGPNGDVFHTMLGVTAGWVFFLVLVLRESDQSFANVYSTAMSIQNLLPRVDRRILAGAVGTLVTVIALFVHDLGGFANFLGLIGSVFVPLAAVVGVDYFLGRGRQGRWDLSERSPARPAMLLPWALGFVVYQVLNPGSVDWWAHGWMHVQDWIHVHPGWWASASLYSFAAAALATGAIVALDRRRTPRTERPLSAEPAESSA
ncbi:purine-cytosine permease family protein [Catenulispora pinisilvae]|uniref:purine-cytosine permease family protein n=1 Tax=Catenulispora pinisilvae TaxID=2705253 RepID=UPI001E57926D|nr:cytosine permease [Catenulispora pinisilvae]